MVRNARRREASPQHPRHRSTRLILFVWSRVSTPQVENPVHNPFPYPVPMIAWWKAALGKTFNATLSHQQNGSGFNQTTNGLIWYHPAKKIHSCQKSSLTGLGPPLAAAYDWDSDHPALVATTRHSVARVKCMKPIIDYVSPMKSVQHSIINDVFSI